jgi:hypothetical protein
MVNIVYDQVQYLAISDDVQYRWISSANGEIVDGAIEVGHEDFHVGKYYIGRTTRDGGRVYVGKVILPEGEMHFPMNDQEDVTESYDVLICEQRFMNLDDDLLRFGNSTIYDDDDDEEIFNSTIYDEHEEIIPNSAPKQLTSIFFMCLTSINVLLNSL